MALEPMPASQAKTTLVICFKSTDTGAVAAAFFDSAFISCIFCWASSRDSPDFALDSLMMGDAMTKETTVAMTMLKMTAKVEPLGAIAR
mgnify:CR=1 FL=1